MHKQLMLLSLAMSGSLLALPSTPALDPIDYDVGVQGLEKSVTDSVKEAPVFHDASFHGYSVLLEIKVQDYAVLTRETFSVDDIIDRAPQVTMESQDPTVSSRPRHRARDAL